MARRTTPTVREAVDAYRDSRRHLALNTRNNDKSCLDRMARSVGPDRQIGNITAQQVQDFFREFDGQAPASWNKAKQRVTGFLSYAQRQQWVAGDLVADVAKKKVPRRERVRLQPDELVTLVDQPVDPRDSAFLSVAVNTGLRSSEVCSLRLRDIDLENGRMYIYRQKTQQADTLTITPALRTRLEAWLAFYRNELAFNAFGKDGKQVEDLELAGDMHLFPARGQDGRQYDHTPGHVGFGSLRPWSPISRPHCIVQRAMSAMGFDVVRQEGLHTVRRSVARCLFEHASEQGYDNSLRVVAALLGHQSTQTTEGYIGVTHDRQKRDALMATDFLPWAETAEVIPIREVQAF